MTNENKQLDEAVQEGMEKSIELTKAYIDANQREIKESLETLKMAILESIPKQPLKTMILPPVVNDEEGTVTSYVAYSNDPEATRITNNWYVKKSTWEVESGKMVGLTMTTPKTFTHSILGKNYIDLEYSTEV